MKSLYLDDLPARKKQDWSKQLSNSGILPVIPIQPEFKLDLKTNVNGNLPVPPTAARFQTGQQTAIPDSCFSLNGDPNSYFPSVHSRRNSSPLSREYQKAVRSISSHSTISPEEADYLEHVRELFPGPGTFNNQALDI